MAKYKKKFAQGHEVTSPSILKIQKSKNLKKGRTQGALMGRGSRSQGERKVPREDGRYRENWAGGGGGSGLFCRRFRGENWWIGLEVLKKTQGRQKK